MKLAEQFMGQVTRDFNARTGGLDLLPALLARACVNVLSVAGAGISMTIDKLRVPLGASDGTAARAERLQTTLGEGPCLDAEASSEPAVFDAAAMAERWPRFYGQVLRRTPYRAIASLPIRATSDSEARGALDLYSTDVDLRAFRSMEEISTAIASRIGAMLFEAPKTAFEHNIMLPLWLANDPVADRMNVWVAVGMLLEYAELDNTEALAAIRSYAISHDATLEETAMQMTANQLPPARLLELAKPGSAATSS